MRDLESQIIAYPIARLLDLLLGAEHPTVYSRSGLKELTTIHSQDLFGSLTQDEVTIIRGVLELQEKCVADVMTPIDRVYRLPIDAVLDHRTMSDLLAHGHSRVPVFEGDPDNIVGMLLVKRLIAINPDDQRPLRSLSLRLCR